MFNNYVWDTYLNAGGKSTVKMFERNLSNQFTEEYINNICEFRSLYCPSNYIIDNTRQQLFDVLEDFQNGYGVLENGEYTTYSALEYFYEQLKDENNCSVQRVFDCFCCSLDYFTTFLAIEIPDLFIPYYYQYNYNVLEKIANEFEIKLPAIPNKKDYKSRFYYYGELCESFLDFRNEHNMTSYELCAFLYDFAPKYIGGTDSYIIKDLPEPKSAYLIGGSKSDFFLNDNKDIITCWQCNPDTMAGDIIVMYLKSPISAIDSIWRSVSIGFNDPLFYYYRCTYIANPKKIQRISQKQLQQDEIFKDIPIVRKNMQGINGVELLPSHYNHLMDIAQADVPRLEYIITNNDLSFTCEKDVENKLIKPLLKRLGYSTDEYEQQLYIEIGNHNHTLIPDFVILPIKTKGYQSAYFLIEAKLSIPTTSMLDEAKMQARSYARQLNAKYSVIASKEGIWVSAQNDDFSMHIFSALWNELNDSDVFFSLYKILGKGK